MKGVLLLSGGIDSPVAGHMMIKQGLDLIYLHMKDGDANNVRKLVKILDKDAKLITFDHTKTQEDIKKNCNRRYQCVLCKRAMYKTAQMIAMQTGAACIVTGENLGQVASQTLDNMKILDQAVGIPVLRPLLGLDKNDIIDIAKETGTYEISSKGSGACRFLPRKPVTKAKLDIVLAEEKKNG